MTMRKRVLSEGCEKQLRKALEYTAAGLDDLDMLHIKSYYPQAPASITSIHQLLHWLQSTGRLLPNNVEELLSIFKHLDLDCSSLEMYMNCDFSEADSAAIKKQKSYDHVYSMDVDT